MKISMKINKDMKSYVRDLTSLVWDYIRDRTVLFRTTPESRVDHRCLVQAEIPNVNNYWTLGWELGFRYPFMFAMAEKSW